MYFIIDIGASKTLFALFSRHGKVLKTRKFPTETSQELFLEYFSENLASFIEPKKRRKIKSIVVGVPGVVSKTPLPNLSSSEQIFYSVKFGNLPWQNIDLITPIKKLFDSKIFFFNDADLATIYESSFYKNKKVTYLTFSTGIGGGIAENRSLLPESASFEPGHQKYKYKKSFEEWEDLASSKAISEFFDNTPVKNLKHNKAALREIVVRLSLCLPDILLKTNPDVLIIGGAVGFIIKSCKKLLLPALKMALEAKISRSKPASGEKPSPTASEVLNRLDTLKIAPARRPLESVIYGGYLYAKTHK